MRSAAVALVLGFVATALAQDADYLVRYAAALKDLDRAVDLEPKNADRWQNRGIVRFKLGQIEGSIADFDKAIELDPKLRVSHWQRGISYFYAGKYDEGRRQFE